MSRTLSYQALVLQVRNSGESNREAFFLTREEGILRAMLFGGPKSRLRAHIAPFHSGTLWLYHDPVRDFRKVSDFDVQSWKPGLRESYTRLMTAGAFVETVLAAQGGGGSWDEAFTLTEESLAALQEAHENAIPGLLYRFIWLWADLLGVCPDLESCNNCACRPADDEVVLYSRLDGSILCSSCAQPLLRQGGQNLIHLDPGARRWIGMTSTLNAAASTRVSLERAALNQVSLLSTELLGSALGRRLACWDSCMV